MRTYIFHSKSSLGKRHTATLYDNGEVLCSCPARGRCWHVKRIKENAFLKKQLSPSDVFTLARLASEEDKRQRLRDSYHLISEEEIDDLLVLVDYGD